MRTLRLTFRLAAIATGLVLASIACGQEKAIPGGGPGWEALLNTWRPRVVKVRSDRAALERLMAEARDSGDDLVLWRALVEVTRSGTAFKWQKRAEFDEEAVAIAKKHGWPKEQAEALSMIAAVLPSKQRLSRGPEMIQECLRLDSAEHAALVCNSLAAVSRSPDKKDEWIEWVDRGFKYAIQGKSASAWDSMMREYYEHGYLQDLTSFQRIDKAHEFNKQVERYPWIRGDAYSHSKDRIGWQLYSPLLNYYRRKDLQDAEAFPLEKRVELAQEAVKVFESALTRAFEEKSYAWAAQLALELGASYLHIEQPDKAIPWLGRYFDWRREYGVNETFYEGGFGRDVPGGGFWYIHWAGAEGILTRQLADAFEDRDVLILGDWNYVHDILWGIACAEHGDLEAAEQYLRTGVAGIGDTFDFPSSFRSSSPHYWRMVGETWLGRLFALQGREEEANAAFDRATALVQPTLKDAEKCGVWIVPYRVSFFADVWDTLDTATVFNYDRGHTAKAARHSGARRPMTSSVAWASSSTATRISQTSARRLALDTSVVTTQSTHPRAGSTAKLCFSATNLGRSPTHLNEEAAIWSMLVPSTVAASPRCLARQPQ